MGERQQRVGAKGESKAAVALKGKGLKMVAEMPTPMVRAPGNRIIYRAKVFGDISAIVPGTGQKVLVEVKTKDVVRLKYSILRPHQVAALQENHELGGLSLLVWVVKGKAHVMRWPIEDFVPNSSLHIDKAPLLEWEGVNNEVT